MNTIAIDSSYVRIFVQLQSEEVEKTSIEKEEEEEAELRLNVWE